MAASPSSSSLKRPHPGPPPTPDQLASNSLIANHCNVEDITIVAICGSLRPGSFTKAALATALEGASSVGCKTKLIDLRDYKLPLREGLDNQSQLSEAELEVITRFRREVGSAKGILIGTPEYHGSYSGVLKNALDFLTFAETDGKLVGILACSGGVVAAIGAVSSLRDIARSLHCWTVPEQVLIPQAWKVFATDGKCTDAAIEKRLKALGSSVAKYSYLHSSEKAVEFLQLLQKAADNPGGTWGEADASGAAKEPESKKRKIDA